MKKIFITLMCIVMVVCFMPTVAMAVTQNPCSMEVCTHAAAIGETHYDTLAKAIADAQPGQTVQLLTNVEVDNLVKIEKNITLDLNGQVLKNDAGPALWVVNADVLITGKGTISSNHQEEGYAVAWLGNGSSEATLTIDKDVTVSGSAEYGISIFGNEDATANLIVNGNVSTTGNGAAISGNGSYNPASITINDGATVECVNGVGIYFPQAGTLTVNGGTITGQQGIQMCSGTLNISGNPTITATGTDSTGLKTGDGPIPDGAAISVVNRSYPGGEPSVTISGTPTIMAAEGQQALRVYTWNADKVQDWDNASVSVTGGTFSSDVFQYVPEGTKVVETIVDDVTKYTLAPITEGENAAVAQVGDAGFTTLQAAINAATDGQKVVLREDTTGDITIPVGAEVTIEGNGKTLKGSIYFTQTKEGGTTKATINNLTLDGQSSSGYGIFGQNTKENGLVVNELTLNNCTIKNFEKKGIYLTNAKKLDINRCTFKDNAKGGTGSEPYGDYAVDLNLYDVQDADISITDCNFEDFSGSKAAIKVTQRGGNDDEGATDGITEEPAKIKQLTIKNCVFNNVKPSNTYLGDIVLGSGPKKDGTPKASCGAFPVTITAEDDTTVCQRYISDGSKVTIPDGQTFTKGANTAPITRVYPTYYPTIPTDSLKAARTEAIKAVSDYVNAADYEEAQQAEIKTIVDNAKKDIEAAKTADEIKAIEAAAKAELDKLETAEEMALIRTIEGTQFTARSKATTLNGKKAIRVTWNKPADLDFDGYEIYRSTERYKGYGTEPFFTTTNQKYTNNKGLKVGKTYYYKVRGFKYVNDEKVYTEYSLKAWRTVK